MSLEPRKVPPKRRTFQFLHRVPQKLSPAVFVREREAIINAFRERKIDDASFVRGIQTLMVHSDVRTFPNARALLLDTVERVNSAKSDLKLDNALTDVEKAKIAQ